MSEILNIEIIDVTTDGRGFGRTEEGLAVFVENPATVVPGDVVEVEIIEEKKNFISARVKRFLAKSPDRVRALCPHEGVCGGCTYRELNYESQLELKRRQVKDKLQRIGGIEEPEVDAVIPAENLDYYRNKATFAVGSKGEVGFMKRGSHKVVDIDDCLLQTDAAMVCADALRFFLRGEGSADYGIRQLVVKTAFGTGEVMVVLYADRKYIPGIEDLVAMLDDAVASCNGPGEDQAKGDASGEDRAKGDASGADQTKGDASGVAGIEYSLESVALIHLPSSRQGGKKGRRGGNKQKPLTNDDFSGNSAVEGKCEVIAGKPTITEVVRRSDGKELKFEISPQSFYQVNPEQMIKLYEKASEYAAEEAPGSAGQADKFRGADCRAGESQTNNSQPDTPGNNSRTLLDLYCGIGTIGIYMADRFAQVIGIESVKPAILDANRNSVINGIVNTRYVCGKAEEELPAMLGIGKTYKYNEVNELVEKEPELTIDHADVVVLDPPRAGCDKKLLEAVMEAGPNRIVYVSCDPATLARDVKVLCRSGYDFVRATPVDMFPFTGHVECVVLMSKVKD